MPSYCRYRVPSSLNQWKAMAWRGLSSLMILPKAGGQVWNPQLARMARSGGWLSNSTMLSGMGMTSWITTSASLAYSIIHLFGWVSPR